MAFAWDRARTFNCLIAIRDAVLDCISTFNYRQATEFVHWVRGSWFHQVTLRKSKASCGVCDNIKLRFSKEAIWYLS
jgi:hypothetical protein